MIIHMHAHTQSLWRRFTTLYCMPFGSVGEGLFPIGRKIRNNVNITVIDCNLIRQVCGMAALHDNVTAMIIAATIRTKGGRWGDFLFEHCFLCLIHMLTAVHVLTLVSAHHRQYDIHPNGKIGSYI